jgi:hypothetical protein
MCTDFGRYFVGETNTSLEAHIKEYKYNLTQGLLEKTKLAQHT